MAGVHTQQLAACDSCFLLKPVEEYARPDGRWETACLACRSSGRAAKRPRPVDEREPPAQLAEADMENEDEETFNSQVDALLGLDLFRSALKTAPPTSARKLMTQLLEGRELGRLNAEMAADVALAYLAQHVQHAGQRNNTRQGAGAAGALSGTPQQQQQQHASPAQQQQQRQPQRLVPPPAPRLLQQMAQQAALNGGQAPQMLAPGRPHPQQQQQQQQQQLVLPGQQQPGLQPQSSPPPAQHVQQHAQHAQQAQQQGQGQQQQEVPPAMAAALRAKQQAAVDAVPPQMLRLILEAAPQRCRARLFAMSRGSPPLLGQLLCSADPASLLAEGHLSSEELLAALQQQQAGQAALPALAAVAAAAALLASAPPGPSPQMLHLVRILAEGHRLMALVEAGHLAPAQLRGALAGAPAEAFTDIFKAMCTSDPAGQSFIKQAMQRAMPRADYGELMRISMLAEVARTAATVTDRTTLLSLLEKAFG